MFFCRIGAEQPLSAIFRRFLPGIVAGLFEFAHRAAVNGPNPHRGKRLPGIVTLIVSGCRQSPLPTNIVMVGENRVGKNNVIFSLRLVPDSARQLKLSDIWDGHDTG